MEEDSKVSEEEAEDREWIESLEYVIENSGRERAAELLRKLRIYSQKKGVQVPYAANREGDIIYFQGHASPGIYARAFLEGTVSIEQMRNFRREIGGDGLSSYPHPWLMPDFWEFPTVSMGLSLVTRKLFSQ